MSAFVTYDLHALISKSLTSGIVMSVCACMRAFNDMCVRAFPISACLPGACWLRVEHNMYAFIKRARGRVVAGSVSRRRERGYMVYTPFYTGLMGGGV